MRSVEDKRSHFGTSPSTSSTSYVNERNSLEIDNELVQKKIICIFFTVNARLYRSFTYKTMTGGGGSGGVRLTFSED